jgi:hypothetical protein
MMNVDDICTVAREFWTRYAAPVQQVEAPLLVQLVGEHSLHCPSCGGAAESARIVRLGLRAAGIDRRRPSSWKDRLLARLTHALAESGAAVLGGKQTLTN